MNLLSLYLEHFPQLLVYTSSPHASPDEFFILPSGLSTDILGAEEHFQTVRSALPSPSRRRSARPLLPPSLCFPGVGASVPMVPAGVSDPQSRLLAR